jgi:hypothetical protein
MNRSVPDFDFFDFADLVEFLSHVFGFWLFIFSPRFRRARIARWQARTGIAHALTVIEIGVSTGCAVILVWVIWPEPFDRVFSSSVA